MDQGSDEWRQARLGKVTASRIAEVMAKLKDGSYGASRANYMAEKITERLTGIPQDGGYVSPAMQWGMDNEAGAKAAYSFITGKKVEPVGFVPHPTMGLTGASPDGLVDLDGLVQIKCPNPATHINTLLTGKVDRTYVLQMQWEMECTQRAWCDFVSFDPRMPPEMQLYKVRVVRNQELITDIRNEIISFMIDMQSRLSALQLRYKVELAA